MLTIKAMGLEKTQSSRSRCSKGKLSFGRGGNKENATTDNTDGADRGTGKIENQL
jgi:hypothetical protein